MNTFLIINLEKLGEFARKFTLRINSTILIGTFAGAFLLATILNVFFSWLFTPKIGGVVSEQKTAQVSLPPAPTSILTDQEVNAILQRNLFNAEGTANDSQSGSTDKSKIQKSDLSLTVIGTIYGGDPASGVAMIENTKSKAINSFMVGDEILPGENAVLSHVLSGRIYILRDNSRYEYLDIPNPELQRSTRRARAGSGKESDTQPDASKGSLDTFSEPGLERKGNKINMSADYRRKMLTSDFTKVLQDAKAEPNMIDGKLKGFRLTRIRDDSIYLKAGLQDGDIVIEINGIELISASQAISTLQSLRDANQIEVTYLRSEKKNTVTLNVSN
jgi:general secretion pathway protein C